MNGLRPVKQLVRDHADRVQVRLQSDIRAHELFGRHVVRRAEHVADLGELRGLDARDAEIADLDPAVVVDQDVGRLDVAMDNACRMRVAESVEQLADDLADFAHFVADFLLQVLGERLAVDELHHDVRDFLVFAEVVNLDDMRMHEPADRLRLVAEALHDVL